MASEVKSRSRTVLTKEQAIEIFKSKSKKTLSSGKKGVGASKIAEIFGVSTKTVRDIWIGRTWFRETHHLDPLRPGDLRRMMCRPGRPKGVKDSKPRARKTHKPNEALTSKNYQRNQENLLQLGAIIPIQSHSTVVSNHEDFAKESLLLAESRMPATEIDLFARKALDIEGGQNVDILHSLEEPFQEDWVSSWLTSEGVGVSTNNSAPEHFLAQP